MLTNYNFVVILLSLSVGYETYASDYKNSEEDVYEEGTFEAKITAALSALKIQNKQILDSITKNIPEQLEKKYQAMDEKFNSLEKHVYRKIDALEKIVPEKTDTYHKLDELNKTQLDFVGSANCTLANNISKKIEEDFNQKLNVLQKTILDLENTTTIFNYDGLDKNLANLKDNIENILRRMDTLDKKIEQNIDHKLEEMQKKTLSLNENMQNKMNVLLNLEKDVLAEVYQTRYGLGCKEERITQKGFRRPYHRMNNETFKHVTYINDLTSLTYFEMHLAVKGNGSAYIMLSPEEHHNKENIFFQIGIYPNDANFFRKGDHVKNLHIPNLLSAARFTALYVKIFNNGTLEMGKEGSSSPLISYSDPALKLVKDFSFAVLEEREMIFLYDCPLTVF